MLKEEPQTKKNDLRRIVFFAGSFFFSARPIPGLEKNKLPVHLVREDETEGDIMACVAVTHFDAPSSLLSNQGHQQQQTVEQHLGQLSFDQYCCGSCSKSFPDADSMLQHCRDARHTPKYEGGDGPAPIEVFVSYANLALQRALGERLAKWGREFVDPMAPIARQDLGVSVYKAYSCIFSVTNPNSQGLCLTLTVDLRAKVIRNKSLLDVLYEQKRSHGPFSRQEQNQLKRQWVGEIVIYKNDKKST